VVCIIEGKGLGVMTTAAIPAGTFVCEYSGEALSQGSLERQEDRKQQKLTQELSGASFVTYAVEINDKSHDHYVDSEFVGNVARFFNHSCDPNMRPVKVDRRETCATLCFFTTTNVGAGEELTWKYRQGSSIKSNQTCNCGAASCAGYV
jgi:SET domain-containing protein